jgi:hypothetical protein
VIATMISRMIGTPVFSDRTQFSVTTGWYAASPYAIRRRLALAYYLDVAMAARRSLHTNLNLLRLGFLALRNRQRQYPIFIVGLNRFDVHSVRQRETATERTIRAFHTQIVVLAHLLLKLALAGNCAKRCNSSRSFHLNRPAKSRQASCCRAAESRRRWIQWFPAMQIQH